MNNQEINFLKEENNQNALESNACEKKTKNKSIAIKIFKIISTIFIILILIFSILSISTLTSYYVKNKDKEDSLRYKVYEEKMKIQDEMISKISIAKRQVHEISNIENAILMLKITQQTLSQKAIKLVDLCEKLYVSSANIVITFYPNNTYNNFTDGFKLEKILQTKEEIISVELKNFLKNGIKYYDYDNNYNFFNLSEVIKFFYQKANNKIKDFPMKKNELKNEIETIPESELDKTVQAVKDFINSLNIGKFEKYDLSTKYENSAFNFYNNVIEKLKTQIEKYEKQHKSINIFFVLSKYLIPISFTLLFVFFIIGILSIFLRKKVGRVIFSVLYIIPLFYFLFENISFILSKFINIKFEHYLLFTNLTSRANTKASPFFFTLSVLYLIATILLFILIFLNNKNIEKVNKPKEKQVKIKDSDIEIEKSGIAQNNFQQAKPSAISSNEQIIKQSTILSSSETESPNQILNNINSNSNHIQKSNVLNEFDHAKNKTFKIIDVIISLILIALPILLMALYLAGNVDKLSSSTDLINSILGGPGGRGGVPIVDGLKKLNTVVIFVSIFKWLLILITAVILVYNIYLFIKKEKTINKYHSFVLMGISALGVIFNLSLMIISSIWFIKIILVKLKFHQVQLV